MLSWNAIGFNNLFQTTCLKCGPFGIARRATAANFRKVCHTRFYGSFAVGHNVASCYDGVFGRREGEGGPKGDDGGIE